MADRKSIAQEEPAWRKMKVIFAGRRFSVSNEVFMRFVDVETNDELDFSSAASLKAWKSEIIGGVYEIEVKGEGKGREFHLRPTTYLTLTSDRRLEEWRMAHSTWVVGDRARREKAKAKEEGKIDFQAAVEPFRRLYAKSDRTGKLAIEVLLLEAIRKGL